SRSESALHPRAYTRVMASEAGRERARPQPSPAPRPPTAFSDELRGSRRSRESRELLEVRLSLFDVGVAPFLRFLAQVIEQRCIAAEVEQSDLAIAIGVHRRLEEPQRHRRQRQHLAAPLERLFLQLRERDDRIDETHLECLLRIVLAAEEPDLARFLLTDDSRQIRRSKSCVERADPRPGLSEARIVGCDRQVADDMQNVTAADRISRHHRDDRLRHAANLFLHIENVEPRDFLLRIDIAALAANALISARTKSIRTFTGQDDDADLGVVAREIERLFHLAHGQRAKRIPHLWSVDRDLRDPVLGAFELDVSELFDRSPCLSHDAKRYVIRRTRAIVRRTLRASPTARDEQRRPRSTASHQAATTRHASLLRRTSCRGFPRSTARES